MTTAKTPGTAARACVDGLCDLLESFGHPDGARLRRALTKCDELADGARGLIDSEDPVAALLESAAKKRRSRGRNPG